ncbi:MAG: large conductance mechanosensitive channel protein MscL [Clostridia bacterium]|nr:large conductance mechanosensitive channel protein MscL [Clostridia bacterium]
MKKFFEEFKTFAMRGNVLDMAIGVVIGSAFGAITTSLVNDIFMPLLGLLTGGINFGGLFLALDLKSYPSIQAANDAGVGTLNFGNFIQIVINFILIAFCMFLVVKAMNKFKKAEPPKKAPRLCPYCKSEIADDATRCPHCTSELK